MGEAPDGEGMTAEAAVRVDMDLGLVRFCRRCDAWYPLDEEFWYRERKRPHIFHCLACKAADRTKDQLCPTCLMVRTRRDVGCHGCERRISGRLTVEMLQRYGLAPKPVEQVA